MSKEKISDILDISKPTVLRILDTLELKGYVDRDQATKNLKPSDLIRAVAQEVDNFKILIDTEGFTIASGKLMESVKNFTDGIKTLPLVSKFNDDGIKMIPDDGIKTLPYIISTLNKDNKENVHASESNFLPEEPKKQKSTKKKTPLFSQEAVRDFYKSQISTYSQHQAIEQYKSFANYLFKYNPLGKPVDHVLKIPEQLSFKQFIQLMNRTGNDYDLIIEKLDVLINKPELCKKQTIYLTLNDYINRDEKRQRPNGF